MSSHVRMYEEILLEQADAGPSHPPTLDEGTEPHDPERRVEDWIVETLDDPERRTLDDAAAAATTEEVDEATLAALRGRGRRQPDPLPEGWKRIRPRVHRGVTVVRLLDKLLLKESVVNEAARELNDLIASGHRRVVLDFRQVERLSSQFLAAVVRAHEQCAASDGGMLKVCGLRPHLAEVFGLIDQGRRIACFDDEASARSSTWPHPSGPRPLPITILNALKDHADPSATDDVADQAAAIGDEAGSAIDLPGVMAGRVRLRFENGPTPGRVIALGADRFRIGRDPTCHLRCTSRVLSRVHAVLERRDGRVVLRDLGSTNGSVVNGRILKDQEMDLHDGDRLQIGPMRLTVTIETDPLIRDDARRLEDAVVAWVREDGARALEATVSDRSEASASTRPDDAGPGQPVAGETTPFLKYEVIEDVLVVTLLASELTDEATLGAVRRELFALLERPLPRRVVCDLSHVGLLSSRALGVLVAHSLRLDRAGGALRLCQVSPRILSTLKLLRLPLLVEVFPEADEAVLSAWTAGHRVAETAARAYS